MIDFDLEFSQYLKDWYTQNRGKLSFDQMENAVADVYELWLNQKNPKLSGQSPLQYIQAMTDDELLTIFLSYAQKDQSPSFIVCDEVVKRESQQFLAQCIANKQYSESFVMLCANLLQEKESDLGDDIFVDWIFDQDMPNELRGRAAEILREKINQVAPKLIDRLEGCTQQKAKQYAADALYLYKHPKVFNLLCELFLMLDDITLYSSYLAENGDERAIPMLKEFAQDCNYAEFLEIRNAVEMLGGELDIERDFSSDPYFLELHKEDTKN